jgi:hypothetical protein
MPRSQTELCNRALSKLQVPDPAAEDVATAQDALASLVEELRELEVCAVDLSSDTDALEIPDEYYNGLARVLALVIRTDFGGPDYTDDEFTEATKQLRRLTAAKATYQTLAVSYL